MAAGETQLTDLPGRAVTGLGADQDGLSRPAGTRPTCRTTAVLPLPGADLVYEVTGDGPAVVLVHIERPAAVNELLTRFLAGLPAPATEGLTEQAEGLTEQGDKPWSR